MTNEFVVSVQVLIKICNSLRMPIHYFVSEEGDFVIPNRESATVPYDRWQPVGWDTQAVEQTFGDGEGRIFWKDVAVVMGTSSQKPHERFVLKRRFRVTDFLATCSHYGISPYRFLIDPNRDGCRQAEEKPSCTDIRSVTRQLKEMNAKYQDLLRRHAALLDRHNELEKTVRELLGETPAMAAEDES